MPATVCVVALNRHVQWLPLAWLIAGLAASLFARPVKAAQDDEPYLEQAMRAALTSPDVLHGGTTPTSPLMSPNNELSALLDGTAHMVETVCQSIAMARHEVLIETYQFHEDNEAGQYLLTALQERVARALDDAVNLTPEAPLRIGLVINHTWPAQVQPRMVRLLDWVRNVQHRDPHGQVAQIEVALYRGSALSVLHSKLAVIDREHAIVMTGNFLAQAGIHADRYNMGAVIRGPVVATLRDDWFSARTVAELAPDIAPVMWPEGLLADHVGEALKPALTTSAGATAAVLTRPSHWTPWGVNAKSPQNEGLLAMLKASRTQVRVLNPALNVAPIMDALVDAIVHRHVQVELLLSLNVDRWVQQRFLGGDGAQTAHTLYEQLLAQGGPAAADRLSLRWAGHGDGKPAAEGDLANHHAKAMTIDDGCFWIGSMNWDWQSWNNSRELSVALFDRSAVQLFVDNIWLRLWSRGAQVAPADLALCSNHDDDAVCRYLAARNVPTMTFMSHADRQ